MRSPIERVIVKALTQSALLGAGLLSASLTLLLATPLQAQEIQPLANIQTLAETFALEQLQTQNYADLRVTASTLDSRLRLRACDSELEAFGTPGGERSGRLTVGIRCSGSTPWTIYVPVQIRASLSVVVIQNALPRGAVLQASDLAIETRTLQELPPAYVSDQATVVGQELTRAVPANALVTPNLLREPQLVNKGQTVTIIADGENFAVKMAGTALQNGAAGQRINVKNTTSGRTVQATIVDAGTVRVSM
ncbi:MAG: flagellar basal body P-ring formation chaperone FlgA [Pseudomonadota bacterium]